MTAWSPATSTATHAPVSGSRPAVAEVAATAEIAASISQGFPQTGMPAWSETLDAVQIQRAAIFIGEKRAALAYTGGHIRTKTYTRHKCSEN